MLLGYINVARKYQFEGIVCIRHTMHACTGAVLMSEELASNVRHSSSC